MIDSISSWSQGIIVAIIIGTIIEMILPDGNNKKYVKTVIGVYILFVIISPIVTAFSGNINFDKLLDYEDYINSTTYQTNSSTIEINNAENIENIYKQKIKEDLQIRLKEKQYVLKKIDMQINLDENDNKYGQIKKLNIQVSKEDKTEESISSINKIEKIEIKIEENQIVETNNQEILEDEKEELKQYIYENYGIEKNCININ